MFLATFGGCAVGRNISEFTDPKLQETDHQKNNNLISIIVSR